MRIVFLMFVCLVLFCVNGVSSSDKIAYKNGQKISFGDESSLLSPDGTFTATTEGGNIFITNNNDHTRYDSIEVQPPVSYIMWTDDSKSIVSIEHLAMIRLVAISQLLGGRWVRREVEVPSKHKIDKYFVFSLSSKGKNLHLGVAGEHSSNGNSNFYSVTFDIDTVTYTYYNVHERTIRLREYNQLSEFVDCLD